MAEVTIQVTDETKDNEKEQKDDGSDSENSDKETAPIEPRATRTRGRGLDVPSGFNNRFQSVILDDEVPEIFAEEGGLSGDDLLNKYFEMRKLSDYNEVVKEEPDKKQDFKTKEGFLYKIGGNSGVWQKRWFVLSKDSLAYYSNPSAKRLLGQLVLEDILKVQLNPSAMVFSVATPGRGYYLGKGLSRPELDSWLEAINYNWVQTKRRAVKKLAEAPEGAVSPEFLADRAYCLESVMTKRGGTSGKWQKRTFYLSSDFITYKSGSDVLGRIPLSSITNVQGGEEAIKGKPNSIALVTPYRVYYIEAQTAEDKDKWIKGLNQNIRVFKSKPENEPESLIEGFLYKEGNNGIWRRRFFIMYSDSLCYFFDQKQEKTLGTIELFKITQVNLDVASQPNSFALVTQKRQYRLATSRAADRTIWIDLLKEQIAKQNIY